MKSNNCSFTYNHYEEIISLLKDAKYDFVSFREFQRKKTHQVILRHDIDLSLESALKMAEIDHTNGVISVFQFLISSEIYNLNSQTGLKVLQQIKSLNHKIGLHVDPIALGTKKNKIKDIQNKFELQIKIAAMMLGNLDSYSFHRPTTYGFFDHLFPDKLSYSLPPCSNEAIFMENIAYRSDSRRIWKNGCICRQIDELRGKSLQLLIHPIWWTHEERSREQILEDYLQDSLNLTDLYLRNNLSFYKKTFQIR